MTTNKSGSSKLTKNPLANFLAEKGPKTCAVVSPVLQQMGKLAAGVASVNAGQVNSGSATGNPRNKCALQPGHSLMDWIRLGSSGKDLTGVGPKAGHLSVTKLELASHNKKTDAWLAIRGKVYNVTEYLPFHPGGADELMKGAGIDATRLFDQVHPWVNYDQILQKCFIGRLVSVDPRIDTESLFGDRTTSTKKPTDNNQSSLKSPDTTAKISLVGSSAKPPEPGTSDKTGPEAIQPFQPLPSTSVLKEPEIHYLDNYPELPKMESASNSQSEESEEPLEDTSHYPRFDWIQRLDWVTVIFYTRAFCNPLIEAFPPTPDKTFTVDLTYDDNVYRNEVTLLEEVDWPGTVRFNYETGKLEVVFRKTAPGKMWENYGTLRQQYKPEADELGECVKYNFVVKEKVEVNYNTFLMRLERTDGCKVVVPLGRHVRIFWNVDGQEMSRSYTPVPSSLFGKLKLYDLTVTDSVCLMIKRYQDGNVSRYLTNREAGDLVHATNPLGDFDLKRLEMRDTFLLLAAGTGITPMLSLLVFLLDRRIKKSQFVRLMFFNKTQRDIPFKNQLEDIEKLDDRLRIDHVLSEPDADWVGMSGHVSKEMIDNALQEHLRDTGYTIRHVFVFVCGPNPFVALALHELGELGVVAEEQVHAFRG